MTYAVLSNFDFVAKFTVKNLKDEVKRPKGPPARSEAPEGPLDF